MIESGKKGDLCNNLRVPKLAGTVAVVCINFANHSNHPQHKQQPTKKPLNHAPTFPFANVTPMQIIR